MNSALRLMSQREAARLLGITAQTLRSWDKSPQAPPRRQIGKRFYYQKQHLLTWLETTKPPKPLAAPRRHVYIREQPEAL